MRVKICTVKRKSFVVQLNVQHCPKAVSFDLVVLVEGLCYLPVLLLAPGHASAPFVYHANDTDLKIKRLDYFKENIRTCISSYGIVTLFS